MKKMLCPQCLISNMYIKNKHGDRLLIFVDENGAVHPKNQEKSVAGFDLAIVYCLGCSWQGSPERLARYKRQ